MDNPIYYLALILACVLILQFGVLLLSTVRRFAHSNRLVGLELKSFESRLASRNKAQARRVALENTWNGNRKFSVSEVFEECEDVWSFYLKPHDGKEIPSFKSGQFLTFQIQHPGSGSRVNRCYSLSNSPGHDFYRVTIKRVADGLVSNWFHDEVREGMILDVKAPAGVFFLETTKLSPVVLIAGGVGITPLMSMLLEISETTPAREVWLFYCVRNKAEHILRASINELSKTLTNFHLHVFYSKPSSSCAVGEDYRHEGRLTLDFVRECLPSSNFGFYICGPSTMMEQMVRDLTDWGVPENDIHREAFGPASVKKESLPQAGGEGLKVEFTRSRKTFDWMGTDGERSVLQLACAREITTIDASGCHAGNCGTCQTAIKSGDFDYIREPGCQVESGSFLPCIAVPKGDLKIDA
jgi:ferredoxin-NADP reductase